MGKRWRMAVLAGMFALVSACGAVGGDGADGVASVSTPKSTAPSEGGGSGNEKDDVDQMRKYAKCMRDHGVDMPDPEVNSDGGVTMQGPAVAEADEGKMRKANEACRELLPNGGAPPKMTAEDIDAMRETAQCLRDRGYDVTDPTMDHPAIRFNTQPSDVEKMNKDLTECGGDGPIAVEVGEGPK